MHTIPENRQPAIKTDICFISEAVAVRSALEKLNMLASKRVWFDKLPFQASVSFRHPGHGATALTFIIDYLHPSAAKANSYRLDMRVSFENTCTGRWICAGEQARVTAGLAKFLKDPAPIVELLAEFYLASAPQFKATIAR